jgi:hypothetical protein
MFAKLFSPARKSSSTTTRKNRLPRRSQFECLERRELMTASPLEISASQLAAVSDKASALTGPAVSSSAVLHTTSAALLKAPAAPSFKATTYSSSQINLSWNTVSGASGYLVDLWVNGAWKQIGSFASNVIGCSVINLSAGTTYYLDVGATNAAGTTFANYVSATTSVAVDHPTPASGLTYSPVNGSLFGPNGPSYLDVQQGQLGDCWLLASLAEVAARDPADIRTMFTADGTTVENGTVVNLYKVRLYNSGGVSEYVTVDTELPSGGGYYDQPANGVLWVALAEKAYAQANGAGFVTTFQKGSDSYGALQGAKLSNGDYQGGEPQWALQALTGKPASAYNINPTNLVADWNAGDLIVLGTSTPVNSKIVGGHAYAMVAYNPSSSMPFEAYNPWGLTTAARNNVYGLFTANAAFISQNFTSQSIGSGAAAGMNGLGNGSQEVAGSLDSLALTAITRHRTLQAIDQVMTAADDWAAA